MLTHALTDTIHLRQPEPQDARELDALVDANREELARWMPWARGSDLETTRAYIARSRREAAESVALSLLVVREHRLAGSVGFNRIDWANRSATIGYWLGAEAQGEGTMTRAVGALVAHAFDTWGLHRLDLRAGTDNARSRAVAERCGFRHEGTLRDAELVDGRWVSHAVYGLLAVDADRGA